MTTYQFKDSTEVDFDSLGTKKVVSGKIVWTPRKGADPKHVKLLTKSLTHLNKMISNREISLGPDGEVA
jgi:hypothetical protein